MDHLEYGYAATEAGELPAFVIAGENPDTDFEDFFLIGDKAYSDTDWRAALLDKNIRLLTPSKLNRGQFSFPGVDARHTPVSHLRQPIESFFHWLHEKTGIQIASKVRSLKGLLLHIFGRLSAALFLLRFNT